MAAQLREGRMRVLCLNTMSLLLFFEECWHQGCSCPPESFRASEQKLTHVMQLRSTLRFFNILSPPHLLFSLLVLKFEHFLGGGPGDVDSFIVTLGGGLT